MKKDKGKPAKPKRPSLLELGVTLDSPRVLPGGVQRDPLARPEQAPQSDSVDNHWHKRKPTPGSLF